MNFKCSDCGKEIDPNEPMVCDVKLNFTFCWDCYNKPENYELINK